ncbi:high-affinity nitrate transporter [Artemisia annua]|uniref:High-affinity nitrate transporter n=1 Tax=Artemisia annua TaxID=35608 RepID=A0A2U1NTI7_ARTAN|nr:high-affinity nitrate transporter [Artemisia annua]
MEVTTRFLVVTLLLSFAATSYGSVTLSSLNGTALIVRVTETNNQVLKAGKDSITVAWEFNQSYPAGTDSVYKTVKVKLCFAPISQKDRKWRETLDLLKKDKTCSKKIDARPYSASNNKVTWTIEKDVPTGTYFVRVYAFNEHSAEVAYGQNTNTEKNTNLFKVQAITGRSVSLDIASVCFSAFSIVSLAGFFYMEKRKGKSSK